MKYKFVMIILLFIVFSCKGQKPMSKEPYYNKNKYFALNLNFIKEVRSIVLASHKNSLIKEKESFINQKIDNKKYLELLNKKINDVEIYNIDTFYNKFLNKIFKNRKKYVNVKNVYFINIGYTGDDYQWKSAILIENFDGNIQLFKNNNTQKEYLSSELIDFTNDFMDNFAYSFDKKSLLINGYFTIDKITAIGENKYEVSSIVAPEMQFYQLEILKKFYELSQD